MIELRTLATIQLRKRSNGAPLPALLSQRKRLAVLCYLALARPRGLHRRDTLFGIFWPESSQERARRSLNQAVHTLRRSLGAHVIRTVGHEVGLDPAAGWCDATELEALIERDSAEAALELYRGDLLPGFFIGGHGEF